MKRRTIIQTPDIFAEIKERTGLSQQDIEQFTQRFTKYDPRSTGQIQKHDVQDFLKECQLIKREQIHTWLASQLKHIQSQVLDFKQVCELIAEIRKMVENLDEQETITGEYIDAFVAMGGNPDRSGVVQRQTIINIIKNEFELTFDMEHFLEGLGGPSQLDFETFCQLFEQGGEDAKSVLTAFSEKNRKSTATSSFNVKYKDFEKWMLEIDQNN